MESLGWSVSLEVRAGGHIGAEIEVDVVPERYVSPL